MAVTVNGPLFGDIDRALRPAVQEIAASAREMMNEFVPKDTGSLRGEEAPSVDITEEGEIVYETDYAPYVYEMGMGAGKLAGTGGRWDDAMLKERGSDFEERAAAIVAGALS